MKLFRGIDWAEAHHDVAIIDSDGQLVAKKRITDNPAGFAELIEALTTARDSADEPIPVAIETPRGLLVASLRATGRPVYSINPLSVARYRERHSVARSESDHADAMTLATFASRFALGIASPGARAALEIVSTPSAAARLSVTRIAAALRRAGRSRNIDQTAAEIKAELRKPQLRQPVPVENAMGFRRLRCPRPSTPLAPMLRASARRLPSPSNSIPITPSSPAFPAWPTRLAHVCSPRLAMTAPDSPTPEP